MRKYLMLVSIMTLVIVAAAQGQLVKVPSNSNDDSLCSEQVEVNALRESLQTLQKECDSFPRENSDKDYPYNAEREKLIKSLTFRNKQVASKCQDFIIEFPEVVLERDVYFPIIRQFLSVPLRVISYRPTWDECEPSKKAHCSKRAMKRATQIRQRQITKQWKQRVQKH